MFKIPLVVIEYLYRKIEERYLEIHKKKIDDFEDLKFDFFKAPNEIASDNLGYIITTWLKSKNKKLRLHYTYDFFYLTKKNRTFYSIERENHIKKFENLLFFIGFSSLENFYNTIENDSSFEKKDLKLIENIVNAKSKKSPIVKQLQDYVFDENAEIPVGHFWCFISGKDGIRKGKLGIYKGYKTCLIIQDEQQSEKYYGRLEWLHNNINLIISFKKKTINQTTNNDNPTFYFKPNGNKLSFDSSIDYFYGTYAGFSSDKFRPVSGKVILERPKEKVHKKIALRTLKMKDFKPPSIHHISPYIYSFLSSTRIEVDTSFRDSYNNIYDLAFTNYADTYWKIYNVSDEAIYIDKCFIKNDLTISWVSSNNIPFHGAFRKVRNEYIHSFTVKTNSKSAIKHIILESNHTENCKYIIGTCTGVLSTNEPFLANLIFERITKTTYNSLKPLVLSKVQNIPQLEELDKIFTLHKRGSFHKSLYSNKEFNTNYTSITNLVGVYFVVYLSYKNEEAPSYKSIHINKLEIFANGQVKMYTTNLKDNYYYQGEIVVENNGIIVMNLKTTTDPKIFMQKIFRKEGIEDRYFSGVFSTSTSVKSTPLCGREFLLKTTNKDFCPQKFPINSKNLNTFLDKNIDKELYPIFTEILIGPTDNYIKGIINPIKRRDNYGEIYFTSACYWANKIKSLKKDKDLVQKVLDTLKQAFIHGYNNIKLIEQEIKEGGDLYLLKDRIDIDDFKII